MTAYQSADYDDLLQRKAREEQLTASEQSRFDRLDAQARQEWENKPQPFMYGGDYADVF